MSNSLNSLLSFRLSRLLEAIALTAGILSFSASHATAGQRPDGQFFFDHAPRLEQTETGGIATIYGGTTYRFTITVPQNAGAPLQALTFTQDANPRTVQFNLNQSRVITANGAIVPLASIGGAQGKVTTIAFEQPIQPGETVTVSLKAERNPNAEGLYQFGITAYPVGDSSNGISLGYGRVRLYSQGG